MKNEGRSAALVRLGKDELALQDIELAVEAGYPKDLRFSHLAMILVVVMVMWCRYKLMERKVKIAVRLRDRAGYHEALAELKAALEDATLDQVMSIFSLGPSYRMGRIYKWILSLCVCLSVRHHFKYDHYFCS